MRNLIVASLLTLAGLAGFAETSYAGVYLRLPFVTVQVDRAGGVYVGAPAVQVQVPPPPRASASPGGVIVSQPAPIVTTIP